MDTQDLENELLAFARREIFPPDADVTAETDLMDAGFDSMSLVRLLQFIEQTYKLWIPESEITGDALANIRSLAATVSRLLDS